MHEVFGADAYAPQEIAARVRDVGVTKTRLPWLTQVLLGVLAGAFIGLGGIHFGGHISTAALLRNWAVVCAANFAGAAGLALLVWLSGQGSMNQGAVARAAVRIAMAKVELPWIEAFFRGVLCNVLVCMAVWMAMAGRSVTDKVLAVVFPISAFVAAGFEHSIANMYFLPLAMLLGAPLSVADTARNLPPVIAGNIVGGSVLVAGVYWAIYLRPRP